jgi:hypothetical protein
MTDPWPYNLPIFRRSHRSLSPNGSDCAEIASTCEVSMSNPTYGTLHTTSGLVLNFCSPSFVWSDDSRYLAVPQFFMRLKTFRRQRMVIIDTKERFGYRSPEVAYYYQPENFASGSLTAIVEPFKSKKMIQWQVPECFERFSRFSLPWNEEAQQVMPLNRP